jgi:ribosomal protein L11 methyltransferase
MFSVNRNSHSFVQRHMLKGNVSLCQTARHAMTRSQRAVYSGASDISDEPSNIEYVIEDVSGEIVEELSDILLLQGAMSTQVTEYRPEGQPEQKIFKDSSPGSEYWTHCRVHVCFSSSPDDSCCAKDVIRESMEMVGLDPERFSMTSTEIRPRDWEQSIRDEYQPMKITDSLWIIPSWCDVDQEHGRTNIILEPGIAFGTGDHPTTRLCLQWLQGLVGTRMRNAETVLLDYGTGSGILAIAALVLGVADVAEGTDVEPLSLKAARHNATLNGISGDAFNVYLVSDNVGDTHHVQKTSPVDIIVANILQGPLKSLAPTLGARCKPKGDTLLALSGVTRHQAADIIQAYSPWFENFAIHDAPDHAKNCEQNDWICITGTSV